MLMKDLQTSSLEQQGMELVELPTNLVFSCPKSVYNKKINNQSHLLQSKLIINYDHFTIWIILMFFSHNSHICIHFEEKQLAELIICFECNRPLIY